MSTGNKIRVKMKNTILINQQKICKRRVNIPATNVLVAVKIMAKNTQNKNLMHYYKLN